MHHLCARHGPNSDAARENQRAAEERAEAITTPSGTP